MASRIDRTLASAGIPEERRLAVAAAHRRAMEVRDRGLAGGMLADDHDARYLHPGRTLLVFLEFAAGADPALPPAAVAGLLPVGPLLESRWPELAAPGAQHLNALLQAAPDSGAWLAGVLGEGDATACLALAEAFDHARHLHQEAPGPERARWVVFARDALLPLAQRLGGLPARRLDWWWDRVGRTLT